MKMAKSNKESIEYRKSLIKETENITFDAAHSLLLSSKESSTNILDCELVSSKFTCFCPKCCSPWMAGFVTPRLIPTPRNPSVIKRLEKKEDAKRLSSKEKLVLCAYREQCNIITIKCTLCKYQVMEKCKRPVIKRKIIEEEDAPKFEMKKKKKRRKKEVNAGLLLEKSQQEGAQDDRFVHNLKDNSLIQNKPRPLNHLHIIDKNKIKQPHLVGRENLNNYTTTVGQAHLIEDTKGKKPIKKKLLETGFVQKKTQKNLTAKERKIKEQKLTKLKSVLSLKSDGEKRPNDLASFLGSLL